MTQVQFKPTPGWIAIPSGVSPRFIEFWERLMILTKPSGTGYSRSSSPDNGLNRNNTTKEMLQQSAPQWIYYLDDDHEFPADSLLRKLYILEQYPQIDALAGFYTKKYPPFKSVLFTKVPPDDLERPSWDRMKQAMIVGDQVPDASSRGSSRVPGLLKVAGCGGGGLLVRRRVIEALAQLHPDVHLFETGPKRAYGPDIGFCMKLRDAGFNLYADLGNPLGHMIGCTITPQWDAKLKAWFLIFKFGLKTFRMPASSFNEYDGEKGRNHGNIARRNDGAEVESA